MLTAEVSNRRQENMMQIHWRNIRSTTFWYFLAGLYALTVVVVIQ